MRRMMRRLSIGVLLGLLSGCAAFAPAPMEVLTYANPHQEADHRCLFVFMRGIGGSHHSFEEEGLVADVWKHGLTFDVAVPNAHLGYYGKRNLVTRLKEDVIDPARARGCRKIWLVGVSMGGLGALLYLRERPEDVAGVYLISPFLGTQPFLDEIEEAGGVGSWEPGAYDTEDDWQRMLWHWMKTSLAGHPEKSVYLGYGADDHYRTGSQLLARLLPSGRVYVIQGGHDYQTFKTLWKTFLENNGELEN